MPNHSLTAPGRLYVSRSMRSRGAADARCPAAGQSSVGAIETGLRTVEMRSNIGQATGDVARRGNSMALAVIGAGFGRTGTWSTFGALNRLGFPCYHMQEVILNKANTGHLDFWRRVGNSPPGTHHDWDRVFANYTATVDNPACCVWRELMAAYPEAKVLLTLHPRGAEAWYDSTIDTIYFTETLWQFKVLEWLTPFGRKFGDLSHKLVWGRALAGVMGEKARAVARYNAYIEEVKCAVPPEKLLVFSVTDGWGPLCRFLGVPEPQEPFPQLNDRESIKKAIRKLIVGSYVTLAAYLTAGVACIAAIWWALA